jgi:hypothetical protein
VPDGRRTGGRFARDPARAARPSPRAGGPLVPGAGAGRDAGVVGVDGAAGKPRRAAHEAPGRGLEPREGAP